MEKCWFVGRAESELPVRTGERRGCPGWRVARPKEDQSGVEEVLEVPEASRVEKPASRPRR
jgi:hypothetical protein